MAEQEVGSLAVSVGLSTVEFNKGIATMSKQMQIVGQDFKNSSAGLDKVGDASKISALKIAELTAKIDIQKGIVDEFREAHARAAEQFGEGSKQALDYELKLKRAEGTLQSMEGQLSSTTDQLEEQNKWVNKNADEIAKLNTKWDGLKETLKNGAKVVAVGLAAMGASFVGASVAGVKMSEDLTKALNGVQASTGVSDEMMGDMRDTMLAIYNNNFGENFEDIGVAMTTVSQQTGLAGEALQAMTEDALALRDTFDMEVSDSVKGANQLMKQFGVDGDTAYNLIAQGAQGGLDANGDLIDTLNEYSGTFKAQGFSAEEMFNMLSNGADSGVRDVDLLADAVKEFGIRSKDGSDATSQAFKDLGLSSDALTKSFGKGGKEGKKAFGEVTRKLIGMKDPIKQNELGVALFGTQFEDLGIKGVTALVDTQGEINKTTDALGKINEVKYNTFGEAMEGIKRNLQTGLLIPLGDQILPKLNEFATWITINMPKIKETIGNAMDTAVTAFKSVTDFITIELVPRFKDIASIAGEITQKYFPDLGDGAGTLKDTLSDLVLDAINLVIDTLKWIRDNSVFVKAAVETITVAWLTYNIALAAVVLATKTVMVMQRIHKAAMIIYNGVMVVAEALQWGYVVALDTGSISLGIIAAAQWLFNAAMSANPITKVITGLALLGIAIYEVVKHWKDIVTWIENARDWLTKWNGTDAKDKNSTVTTRHVQVSSKYEEAIQYAGNNATGTNNWRGGLTRVNEKGGEIVNLPSGTQIIPNDISMQIAKSIGESVGNSNGVGNVNVNLIVDGKTLAQVMAPYQYQNQRGRSRGQAVTA